MAADHIYITDKGLSVLNEGKAGEHGWMLSSVLAAGSEGIPVMEPNLVKRVGDLREVSNAFGLKLITYDKRALAQAVKDEEGVKYGNLESFLDDRKRSYRYMTSKKGIKDSINKTIRPWDW